MQYELHRYGYAMNNKQYFIAGKEAMYKSLSLTYSHLPPVKFLDAIASVGLPMSVRPSVTLF